MFECFEFENGGGTGGFASSTDLARRAGPVAEGDPDGYQLSALLSNLSNKSEHFYAIAEC